MLQRRRDYKKHPAADKILSVAEWKISEAVVLCKGNVERAEKFIYLPWYMVTFLTPQQPPAFQRVQMQLENSGQGVAMFIMDELDSETDRKTKNSCHSLISKGDMFVKFNNIFPSVMVDFSHQNYGIQLADYVSGVATGILKYASVKKGYEFARDLYGKFIANKLRRNNKNGEVRGCGVLDVPHNSYLRGELKVFESGDSIKEVKKSKLSIPLDSDIPF